MSYHPRYLRSLVTVLLTAIALESFAQPAHGQPLAELVPDDAVLYIGWRGVDQLGAEYDQSNLKALIDASGWQELLDKSVPALVRRIVREERDAAPGLHVARQLLSAMWHHETMFCMVGADRLPNREPQPRIVLICQAGEDAQDIAANINALSDPQRMQRDGMRVAHDDGRLIVSFGFAADEALVHADAATSLAQSAHFKRALAAGHQRPVMTIYLNAQSALQLVDRAMLEARDPQAAEMWPKIADALGITNLKQIVYTGGFAGKQWTDSAFIEAPAPRTGLLSLLDGEPLDGDAMRAIPATATRFNIVQLDFAKVLGEIRTAAAKIDPQAQQEVDTLLRQAQAVVMLDLERGLINALGPRWAAYIDPASTGGNMMNFVVTNQVRDKAKLMQTLNGLANTANMLLATQLREAEVQLRFKQRRVDDLTITYLAAPVISPAWAMQDGVLYFALHPQTVVTAAAGARNADRKSILDNKAFAATMQQLQHITGAEAPNSVSYSDVPTLAPQGYASLLILSQSLAGAGELFGVDAPMMLAPRFDQISPLLSPSTSVTWTDDAGWHMQSLSAFPGAEIMTMEASMMQVQQLSMMTGIMLPALGAARRTARRVEANTQLRGIIQAAVVYADNNDGRYPPDLVTMIEADFFTPDMAVSRISGIEVPPEFFRMSAQDRAAWIHHNSSFVLVPLGQRVDVNARQIVGYGRPDHHGEVIPVGYADAHVVAMNIEQAMMEIRQQYPDHQIVGAEHHWELFEQAEDVAPAAPH